MEVSSTSSNATTTASSSPLLNTGTENESDPNPTESASASVTVSIAKDWAGSSDCDLDTVPVPYGPIVSPHFYPTHSAGYSKDVKDSKAVHGSSGLYNLGNTCYMNSGLQSLISCAPLVKFFAENYSFDESNRHMLTHHFYVLLSKMWSGQFSVVHPRTFKDFLGLYHSQFEDYRQHDCQEFLAFLLDTLHEQLNVSTFSLSNNNICGAAPVPNTDETASKALSISSLPNTSAMSLESEKSAELSTAINSVSDACLEVVSESCGFERNHVEVCKEEGGGFAAVSAASSLPQSCGECFEGVKNSSPDYNHFEVDNISTAGTDVSSGGEAFRSSSMEDSREHLNGDSDLAEKSDCSDCISSSCSTLTRYASRTYLEDVTSSDMSLTAGKPSLKRVSSDSAVTASGLVFLSEDSNQSSVSVHSTDSEQSSAFKKLKIDSLETMNKNSNSNNNSQRDFVSSSSDCKAENPLKARNEKLDSIVKCNEVVASSSTSCSSSALNKTMNTINSGAAPPYSAVESLPSVLEMAEGDDMTDLEDFYRKETKTLNTNVLVKEHSKEIACDSEKFAKVDNRSRPPSKEVNLLQEAFGEEDKVDKLLISQRFGLKENNIIAQASSSVRSNKSNTKSLNNDCGDNGVTCSALARAKLESSDDEAMEEKALSPLRNVTDGGTVSKLDEVEKNVQMQAYSKFNTIPARSNIRTDLIDTDPVEKAIIDLDEVEDDDSSDEDVVQKTSHGSNVDDCSSIPNCLRHCSSSSEIAMANEAWVDYKARNNSIIVSTFQGQFRSTVVCSECNHVSVTYEPFMYLSLPIPHAMEQQLCLTYISLSKPPVRYLLNLLKTDKIGTAKKKLKEILGQTEGDVIMAEMLDLHVSRILDDNVLLKYVNTLNRKIYAFEAINMLSLICNADVEPCPDQLLNNKDEQQSSVSGEDLHLGSASEEVPGAGLLCRRDSQTSNRSLDSITANTPTSRDTMDLGFSDTEMCESTSTQEDIGLSSSYFHEERREEDDICQSTSEEPEFCSKVDDNSDNISSTTSLSWQIVDEKEAENVNEIASTDVASSSRSPSSLHGDEDSSPCSSDFPINKCESSTGGRDSVLGTGSISRSAALDAGSSSPVDTACDEAEIVNMRCPKYGDFTPRNVNAMEMGDDSDKQNGSSRSCPSPETFACSSNHTDVLMQAASRLSESPGSYFLQASQFDVLGPICQTAENPIAMVDSSCQEEEPPIMGDGLQCMAGNVWPGLSPLMEESPTMSADPSGSTHPDVLSASAQPNVKSKGEGGQANIPSVTTIEWRSCAICLEDLPSSHLLTHVSCDGVFCQNCLDMSVKHTADVSVYCCPICLQPANLCEDFVHLPTSSNDAKSNIRMLPVCITYRHTVIDNVGTSSLQLLGHPNILQLPSVISGEAIYALVDRMLGRHIFTYSIMLADGQGLSCSRCPYASHCTGCEVPREGDLSLHPSDCLTVHSCEMLTPDEVADMQYVCDHISIEGLRSSEPTTLMDCFRAFTQSEILDEHNPWYCPQCQTNQCAKKTMTVWRYPDSLIIHLKRFVYQDLSSTKVDAKVTFPHQAMDMRGFQSGPASSSLSYNLYSVICHFGSASSGHYTCFTKHPLTSQWYYYNDETVSPQTPSDNEFTNGYVLFYQRQGTEVEFSPLQYHIGMEESSNEDNAGSTSAIASTAVAPSSMALVPFIPPITSPPPPASSSSSTVPPADKLSESKKVEPDDDEDDDDYDCERRCSPFCDYDSLSVHFDSHFPGDEMP